MAGLGFIVGGALKGYGTGVANEAKALREQRFREMGWAHDEKMAQAEREFRSAEADEARKHDYGMADRREKFDREQNDLTRAATRENREDTQSFTGDENAKERDLRKGLQIEGQEHDSTEKGKDRDFTREQKEGDRAFTRDEAEKNRKHESAEADKTLRYGADVVTDSDGNTYVREGDKLKPLTTDQGKAIKILSAKDKPADVQTAEWLVQNGVAANAEEAFAMVKQTASDRKSVRQAIFIKAMETLTKGAFADVDPEQLEKDATAFTDKAMKYLEQEAGQSTTRGGMGTEDATKPAAKDAIEEAPTVEMAPADPAKRSIGRTYQNQKGQRARWTEQGWQLVE